MKNPIVGSRGRNYVLFITLFSALVIAHEGYADWRFVPTVSVGIEHSDNINLTPPGSEESDQALTFTPGFTARYQGPRFNADIDYNFSAYNFIDNNNLDETYHRLAATASAQLVSDVFFIEGGAAIRQQILDPASPAPNGSIAASGNLSDEYTSYIGPRWHFRLSDRAQADMRYVIGDVRYEDDALNDSKQRAFAGVLESIIRPDRLYWGAKYKDSRVEFDGRDEIQFEQGTLEVGIPVSGRLRMVLLVGEERNSFVLANGEDAPDDDFWLVGMRSQRADHYEFELMAGERVFGNTGSLRWIQRGRQWSIELQYNEDYVTYAETRLDIDPSAPGSILPGPSFSTAPPEVYLRERAQLSATLTRPKTSLRFRVYDESRVYQTVSGSEDLSGYDLGVDWRFTSLTTLMFTSGRQESSLLGVGATDELDLYAFGIERRLGSRTTGTLTLRRADLSSENPTREYIENSVTLQVTFTF